MAKEAAELLARLYESLDDDHPDKKHIQGLVRTNAKYLFEHTLRENAFASAYEKMRFLVAYDRQSGRLMTSEGKKEAQWDELEEFNEEFGEDSAFSIIPIGTSVTPFLFRVLHEQEINTKDQLAAMTERNFDMITGAGKERRIWLATLRDMAKEDIERRDKPQQIYPKRT